MKPQKCLETLIRQGAVLTLPPYGKMVLVHAELLPRALFFVNMPALDQSHAHVIEIDSAQVIHPTMLNFTRAGERVAWLCPIEDAPEFNAEIELQELALVRKALSKPAAAEAWQHFVAVSKSEWEP